MNFTVLRWKGGGRQNRQQTNKNQLKGTISIQVWKLDKPLTVSSLAYSWAHEQSLSDTGLSVKQVHGADLAGAGCGLWDVGCVVTRAGVAGGSQKSSSALRARVSFSCRSRSMHSVTLRSPWTLLSRVRTFTVSLVFSFSPTTKNTTMESQGQSNSYF